MKFYSIKVILILLVSITFSFCKGQGNNGIKEHPTSTPKSVSKLGNRIWDIYQDSKDNYWFGSNGYGIYCYDFMFR